ncbi:DNA replication licensing factor [Trichinella spiralis]|uniref:DNA replication licensing factor n=1 Tax=Trichinella spiralis TaxID=6334 RepID=A0ABR3K548_TRISP
MIRLSEAVARMYCCDTVEVKHVEEAVRLLNKSIVRVEQPDVDLNEADLAADEEPMEIQEKPTPSDEDAEQQIPSDEQSKEEKQESSGVEIEELLETKSLVEKIVHRLIHHDNVLLMLTDDSASTEEDENDPIIVVHPNFAFEND